MPSSVILAMRYDPRGRELLIVFRGARGAYVYFDVAEEEWVEFRSASSKGTYLNHVFKARHPRFEKVETPRGRRGARSEGERSLEWGECWALQEAA